MNQNVKEFIEHHGVKGMRWGVRSKSSKSASSKSEKSESKPTRKVSSDFKKSAPLRGKKVSELTNKQLKEVNERLNLEQNYARMNPSAVKRGAAKATSILATVGIAVTAYNMVNSPAGQAAMTAGKRFMKVAPKIKMKDLPKEGFSFS